MKYDLEWLKARVDGKEPVEYMFFWGHANKLNADVGKFLFSQWYPSPFTVNGIEYRTAEHWMMAGKARLFNDQGCLEGILKSIKPGEAKAIGRKVKDFDEAVWKKERFDLVVKGNVYKFGQNEMMKNYLFNTGEKVLVEASPVDRIWGIGLSPDAKNIEDPNTWRGLNLLGFALMEARDILRDEFLRLFRPIPVVET